MALMVPPRGIHPGDLLVVVHDFEARSEDELTLRRGEKIVLVELDDGFGDGWYLGKQLDTGITGLFPGVYTAAASKIPPRRQPDTSETVTSNLERDEDNAHANTPPETEAHAELPTSGDKTPQGSRHVSTSDMHMHFRESEEFSPGQQQRSSSSPLPTTTLVTDIQHTIDSHLIGEDSPVMNETLSVIDEHITDLSTPRHSVVAHDQKTATDSSSEYSSNISHRLSYINGHETDEEEENQPTEEQVRNWDHIRTAKQLRDLGVEERHCRIFEEQEIAGDVLLDMDQNFIFMKEFDFGVMGRRLKTWHKIKAFQEEVRRLKQPYRSSASGFSGPGGSSEERPMSRANNGPLLPRIPSLSEEGGYQQSRGSGASMHTSRRVNSGRISNSSSPLTPQSSSYGMEFPPRPSAASIRQANRTRRHSSIDASTRSPVLSDAPSLNTSHRTKSSFDRAWTMSIGAQQLAPRPGTSLGTTTEELLPPYVYRADTNESDSAISVADKYDDLDRGYFSQTEMESRRSRRVLRKRSSMSGSVSHSRKSSFTTQASTGNKRHSRVSSADSIRDAANHLSAAAKTSHATSSKNRFRSFSTRISGQQSHSPNVSTGDDKSTTSSAFFSSRIPSFGKPDKGSSGRPESPLPQQPANGTGPKFRRAMGLRVISDVMGKSVDPLTVSASPVKDHDPSSTRTGSTTPSATSKSSERHSTDNSAKNVESGASLVRAKTSSMKGGVKSKKDTSAYMQGLEKKTPQEQINGCDYYGWMKKRSSHLVAAWKPRLFVLRGRRLSYYYSLNDTEERGLIDITAHRVLRADSDPLVAIHATITGATVSPTSPSNSHSLDSAIDEASASPEANRGAGGPFFFKLVPPKSGSSRTVQFTKPTVHYFQVDDIKQGRLWMAALMKATIERVLSQPVESTNKQKTVSLRQARMMNQRPPALMGIPATETEKHRPRDEDSNGLMVKGLSLDKAPIRGDDKDDRLLSGDVDIDPASFPPESLAALKSGSSILGS